MKIVVCIKQVPDTAEVKLDPKTNTLIREGVPSIINHDDKAGLEAALRLREQVGGTVTVVCMGPPQADVALREALAMGADEAYLLSAREFGGSDTYATATIIAAALKKIGFDLVITGRQAIDGDTAQVGPQIAEQLGVPQVSYAEELTLEELAMLPHLTHNIPRLGTMTVMPLIRYYPEDISRLRLLADMYQELMVGRACPDAEVRALLTGHSEYLLFKKGKEVRIIT